MPNELMNDRQKLQFEVLQIQNLVSAAYAVWPSDADNGDSLAILEMAERRLKALNLSLDSINEPTGEAA